MITISNASFNISDFQLLNQEKIIIENFLLESFRLTEIISIIFIILLVELELFYNNDNFDSYFVALKGKNKYFIVKIISYLFIIFFYTTIIFIGIMLVYLVRFKNTEYLYFIFECFIYYLLYFILYFFVGMMFLLLFKNYFSAMLVFLYYWFGKMLETDEKIILAIFPNIYLNILEKSISFKINILFVGLYVLILIFLNKKVYMIKDMKLIS